jgi:hypothetical protein
MKGYVRTLAAGVSSAVVVLGPLAAPAAAKGKRQPGTPVLAITKIAIKELPGDPPYILLDESSRAPAFSVAVSVENDGGRPSGKSVVAVTLEEKGKRKFFDDKFIDPLSPKTRKSKPKVVTLEVNNLQADLGFLKATATVKWSPSAKHPDRVHTVSESAPPIPVVAKDWNVSSFHTSVNVGGDGPSSDTNADGTLQYRFLRFDESEQAFIYRAWGQVTVQGRYNAGGCSGSGSANDTQSPWPGPGTESELAIKHTLTQYSAGVVTKTEKPVTFNATCPALGNFSMPVTVPWENLETFTGSGGLPAMTPDQTTLTDEGSKPSPVGDVKFQWTFNARLSGA